jgi:hypothetical protein
VGLLNLNTKAEYLRQKGEGRDPVRVTVHGVTPVGLLNLNTKAEYLRQKEFCEDYDHSCGSGAFFTPGSGITDGKIL